MDSKHTCILRHEGDAMMFAGLSAHAYCALRRKAEAFQALLRTPAGDPERWGCPIFFDTVMTLGPRVVQSHGYGNWPSLLLWREN